jgi:multidrug efflux system membrane fusion protein
MSKRLHHIVLLSLLLVGVGTGGTGALGQTKEQQRRVIVAPVVEKSLPLRLEYIGNVKPVLTAAIKARVMGYITSYHFREGEDVEKDQLLFTIDPRPYEANLDAAKSNLVHHQAELAYAQEEEARFAKLADQGWTTKEDYDRYVRNVAIKESLVKTDEAIIGRAQLDIEYSSVKAPFSGRTGRRLVDPGNLVVANGGPSDPTLVVINQIDPIKVEFAVPQQDLQHIREAHRSDPLDLEVLLGGDRETVLTGKLWLVDNKIDTSTGMILLHGMIDNPDQILWPGQYVKVRVRVGTSPSTLVIPSEAISLGQQGPFVFTVTQASKSKKQLVTVGRTVGSETVIKAGLQPGQKVVIEGQAGLQSGMAVRAEVR